MTTTPTNNAQETEETPTLNDWPIHKRREAKALGLKKYFTGKNCINGHLDLRITASGACYTCQRNMRLQTYLANPEKFRQRAKDQRSANPELDRQRRKEAYDSDPERFRGYAKRHGAKTSSAFNGRPEDVVSKICTGCKEDLPAESFATDRYQKSGLNLYCRDCISQQFQRWRQTPLYEKRLAKAKETRQELKRVDPKMRWAKAAKNGSVARAKRWDREHDISTQWLYENLPERCPLLDIPLRYDNDSGRDDSAALDRKDNTKGYTQDNCWVVSMKANRIKTDATPEELMKVALNLQRLLPSTRQPPLDATTTA